MKQPMKGAAARKIALGVAVAAVGVAIIPTVGPFGLVQVLAGGVMVYFGVLRLKKEINDE